MVVLSRTGAFEPGVGIGDRLKLLLPREAGRAVAAQAMATVEMPA